MPPNQLGELGWRASELAIGDEVLGRVRVNTSAGRLDLVNPHKEPVEDR